MSIHISFESNIKELLSMDNIYYRNMDEDGLNVLTVEDRLNKIKDIIGRN